MSIKFFESPDDYWNWERLADNCDLLEGLTQVERERAKRAFQYLHRQLGDKFLEKAFRTGHPITLEITNLTAWTRRWITWLADALSEFEGRPNIGKLINKLAEKDSYSEGLLVLEVAYRLSKIGFQVAFDPSVPGNPKVPDLKVVSKSREELFVEVSTQTSSIDESKALETSKEISGALMDTLPFLIYSGRIHRTLSKKHLQETVERIKEIVNRVKTEKTFHELVIEDVLELGIAPDSDKKILQEWAESRGLKPGEFGGPPIAVDEIRRTKQKIAKEQSQLPLHRPNILVIKSHILLFFSRIEQIISELEETVYEYPHLLFVVITGEYIGEPETMTIMKDQHVFIRRTRTETPLVEENLILLNRFCDTKVTSETISKVYTAFTKF